MSMAVKGAGLTRTNSVPGQAGRAAVAPVSLLGFLGSVSSLDTLWFPGVRNCFHDLGGVSLAYLQSLSRRPC